MPRKFAKKYVVEDRTDGVLRFYFRKKGQKKVRLPGVPGSDEFNKAYYEALDNVPRVTSSGPKMPTSGTIRWLCTLYFQSAEFRRLDQRTRSVRKRIIESIWAEPIREGSQKLVEDMPVNDLTPKSVRIIRDRKSATPEAANGRIKALRAVFSWATSKDVERAQANPARDVAYFPSVGDGYHTWTEEEVAKFEQRHPIGTKARLALALMLFTGQRRGDIILFGRQHVSNERLRFTQQKNKNRKPVTLEIPIHPELRKVIDATNCGELTFLVTEFGKPYSNDGFGNYFRRRCIEAGIPHCSPHGLRKCAATRLADRGATEKQIMAFTGHTTSKEVARYTKAASQKRLVDSAVALLGTADKVG